MHHITQSTESVYTTSSPSYGQPITKSFNPDNSGASELSSFPTTDYGSQLILEDSSSRPPKTSSPFLSLVLPQTRGSSYLYHDVSSTQSIKSTFSQGSSWLMGMMSDGENIGFSTDLNKSRSWASVAATDVSPSSLSYGLESSSTMPNTPGPPLVQGSALDDLANATRSAVVEEALSADEAWIHVLIILVKGLLMGMVILVSVLGNLLVIVSVIR